LLTGDDSHIQELAAMSNGSNASDDVIARTAELLREHYLEKGEETAHVPQVESLQGALRLITGIGELFLPNKVSQVADKISEIIGQIKAFQAKDGLIADGFLGIESIARLLNRRRCPGKGPGSPPPHQPLNSDAFNVRYFIDKSFHDEFDSLVGGEVRLRRLVGNAWVAWSVWTKNLAVQRLDEKARANVTIMTFNGDGPGGTVGESHVGGPGRLIDIVIRLDTREDWTIPLLQAALTHECGHALGIGHINAPPAQLMNAVLPQGVVKPEANDITEIQRIWGVGPGPTPTASSLEDIFS
jgi:hypothetical protein